MATVYLADDLRHERKVALKVLKPELAAVVGADRFLAEIKTTANLQHPHIVPLFDSGEAAGFLYYVMPYVEGESLRERLDREHQLPVDEAVQIAKNVAEALDYAHRHGVIHRDIKPANVLLQDGKPVVSDFGIALALGVAGAGRLTETGLSLGTPHYMSPEQATGDLSVGPATDIYALGCALYEMLVGEPPYTGSTPQAVLGKIVTEDADSVTKHRRAVPANVDAAVQRALEKLPADRFSGANELARALGDEGFRHGTTPGVAGARMAVWRTLALVATATAVLGTGVSWWALGRSDRATPVTRFALTLLPDVSAESSWRGLAISPDGRTIVFGDEAGNLYRRDLGDADPVPIPGTQTAWYPFFSPDGEWIGYVEQGQAVLRKVRLDGTGGQTLAPFRGGTRSAAWGDDGFITVSSGALEGLARVPEAGGEPEEISGSDGPLLTWIAPIDGIRAVLATQWSEAREWNVVAVSLETGQRNLLFPGNTPRYVASGHVLFWREGAIWAAPFDADQLRATGDPIPLIEGVPSGTNALAQFAVGGDLLMYREGSATLVPTWVTRVGNTEVLDPELEGVFTNPAVSPDGSMIAFTYSAPGDNSIHIWIYDVSQGTFAPLTFTGRSNRYPFWSADGTQVGFSSPLDGPDALYTRPVDLSADAQLLVADPEETLYEGAWTPGGGLIYRRGGNTGGTADIWYDPPDAAPAALVESAATEREPTVSPDGQWIAYSSNQSGQREVYVRPFPSVLGQTQVSVGGGQSPVWAPNGRELLYLSRRASGEFVLIAAQLDTDRAFDVVARDELFPWGDFFVGTALHPQFDVSPNGRILAIGPSPDLEAEGRYLVVLGISTELRQRVPN